MFFKSCRVSAGSPIKVDVVANVVVDVDGVVKVPVSPGHIEELQADKNNNNSAETDLFPSMSVPSSFKTVFYHTV